MKRICSIAAAIGSIVVAGTAQAASAEQILWSFPSGIGSYSTPVFDAAGNLYGTTLSGGASHKGLVFELSPPAPGAHEWAVSKIHQFDGTDGRTPGTLALDAAGNLYGMTQAGGKYDKGLVFKLTKPAIGNSAWTETILHTFNGTDGFYPFGGVVLDTAGNLYGTTSAGGLWGYGTVFKLTPRTVGGPGWTATTLHNFRGNSQRPFRGFFANPEASVTLDAAGNLYGTAASGGWFNAGGVYKLSPPAGGTGPWIMSGLTSFRGGPGASSLAGVVFDEAGNLYGTNSGGPQKKPALPQGRVWELVAPAIGSSTWTEVTLFSFNGTNGSFPGNSTVTFDTTGNLYGTTDGGGPDHGGNVFKLTPPVSGQRAWHETVLRTFTATNRSPEDPWSGVALDADGNLYGTTQLGGRFNKGVVYKLAP